ncbi:3-Ketoacyl-Acyl Carrier Protein Synthase III [Klebsormidium nitens]|uniref:beta-ketoacyl-[acyl-carrier-protein] synthase III n=1 Tax=Klebsormidium nitens TaxID=105231 RepID=A0A1Y1IP56_KLENI|nr:3-Ketoacyl-Acyl Carrier Protein Synthase III [Klebsormidium nitens]|eukprot:GAQ89898.1 3-Ketoacyl-Acyl Carrier Protein Synthase III [Klebsormidium nitens]
MDLNVIEEPKVRPVRRKRLAKGARFIGVGSVAPTTTLSNDDLSAFVDTNDEWIATRTGIRARKVLQKDESLTAIAAEAGKRALEMAGVAAEDVDLVLLCTSSPDDLFGSATQIQSAIGAKGAAFDLTAACSGFVIGLINARQWVTDGKYHNVLVIGADALSRYVDWTDRGTCILFGDGAGAVLVQATAGDDDRLLGYDIRSDGGGYKSLKAPLQCTAAENAGAPPRGSFQPILMNGREVFKFAVKAVPQTVSASLEEAGLLTDDIDWLVLHQANQRILDAVAERFHIPHEKVISNLANYGNTSAASIPLALDEAVRGGKIKPGDVIASAGFGAGLTWASAIFTWG